MVLKSGKSRIVPDPVSFEQYASMTIASAVHHSGIDRIACSVWPAAPTQRRVASTDPIARIRFNETHRNLFECKESACAIEDRHKTSCDENGQDRNQYMPAAGEHKPDQFVGYPDDALILQASGLRQEVYTGEHFLAAAANSRRPCADELSTTV